MTKEYFYKDIQIDSEILKQLKREKRRLKLLYIFDFILFSISYVVTLYTISDIVCHYVTYGKYICVFVCIFVAGVFTEQFTKRYERIAKL